MVVVVVEGCWSVGLRLRGEVVVVVLVGAGGGFVVGLGSDEDVSGGCVMLDFCFSCSCSCLGRGCSLLLGGCFCSGREPARGSRDFLLCVGCFWIRYWSTGCFRSLRMEDQSQSAQTAGTPHSWVCRSFSGFTGPASLHIRMEALGVKYSL